MIKQNEISNQENVIFELDNEAVFDTALATCQHSITPL
jgi:hypothetical protein